jgi:hypothetical protein
LLALAGAASTALARTAEIYPRKETPMPDSKATIEVYIALNEEGEFETGASIDEASERLTEKYGGQMVRRLRNIGLLD